MYTDIRKIRESKNMTQEELAVASGVHAHTISRIETEQQVYIHIKTLHKIAKGLGVSVAALNVQVG